MIIYAAFRDLMPCVQFKKRGKHPWRSVTLSKVAGFKSSTLLKVTLFHGCFSRFLNCTNGTKSRKVSHMINMINIIFIIIIAIVVTQPVTIEIETPEGVKYVQS